jgi:CYTH domain-containing protein
MVSVAEEVWRRTPGQGKYARPERERRFVVTGDPGRLEDSRLIEDRYLDGGTLRLRAIRGGGEQVFKLTQKVRPRAEDPAVVAITNLYLSEDEYRMLLILPGADLTKTRSLCEGFAVDVFHGSLEGLRLAELEVEDLGAPGDLPAWIGAEVTSDDGFSGGVLARRTSAP